MKARLKVQKLGFTLIEMLVVMAIIAILASVLFPVFAQVREKSRAAQCLSNERQLGLALTLYQQDNDGQFPNGVSPADGRPFWSGEGWAGQCFPYIKQPGVLRCPDDPTPSTEAHAQTVSYGYNINLVSGEGYFRGVAPSGQSLAQLRAPAQTVALYEVSGVTVNLADSLEGAAPKFAPGPNFSASGMGLDNRLYAQTTVITSTDNQYATGVLGNRSPMLPSQFHQQQGRHSSGSNFLLADGHVRWLRGDMVSSGLNALSQNCTQDNIPAVPACTEPANEDEPVLRAAGTSVSAFLATFSVE